MNEPDTVYGHRAWSPPGPNPTLPDRIAGDAILRALALAPPPVQRVLFPPRFGYRDGEIGIREVISVDRTYSPRADDFSGTPAGYSGTSTPSLNWW